MVALLLASLLAAPAPAGAPAGGLSDAQLDARIAEAHKLGFAERVEALSRLFLGVPYGEFPLGDDDGPEPGPRWRTDAVDCQTYVETVLAMANARGLAEARRVLDDLRYADGVPRFTSRNHFTEAQWLPANERKGYLADEAVKLDPKAPDETLVLSRSAWTQVPGLRRLAQANIPDGRFSVRYLPLAEARRRAAELPAGSVILVVRKADPARVVRISHMGLVVRTARGAMVRHASFGKEHAVIEQTADEFLANLETFRKWPVEGVALARALDATARVQQLTAQRR